MQTHLVRISLGLGLSALSLGAGACADDGGVGVSVAALRGDGPAADGAGTEFTITAGQLYLRHIELDLPSGRRCADVEGSLTGVTCEDSTGVSEESKLRIDGPFAVDLLTATSTPSLAGVVIPAGTYGRIDLRVDDGDPADGVIAPGSALDDNAFVVEAGFDWNGTPTTLDLRLNFDEDIRIEQPGGVVVAEGEDLIARFAAGAWLAGVDLVGCLDGEGLTAVDGKVTIDDRRDGACGGIEDRVKNNMKESGDLSSDD